MAIAAVLAHMICQCYASSIASLWPAWQACSNSITLQKHQHLPQPPLHPSAALAHPQPGCLPPASTLHPDTSPHRATAPPYTPHTGATVCSATSTPAASAPSSSSSSQPGDARATRRAPPLPPLASPAYTRSKASAPVVIQPRHNLGLLPGELLAPALFRCTSTNHEDMCECKAKDTLATACRMLHPPLLHPRALRQQCTHGAARTPLTPPDTATPLQAQHTAAARRYSRSRPAWPCFKGRRPPAVTSTPPAHPAASPLHLPAPRQSPAAPAAPPQA